MRRHENLKWPVCRFGAKRHQKPCQSVRLQTVLNFIDKHYACGVGCGTLEPTDKQPGGTRTKTSQGYPCIAVEGNCSTVERYRVRVKQRLGASTDFHSEVASGVAHNPQRLSKLLIGVLPKRRPCLSRRPCEFCSNVCAFFRKAVEHRPARPREVESRVLAKAGGRQSRPDLPCEAPGKFLALCTLRIQLPNWVEVPVHRQRQGQYRVAPVPRLIFDLSRFQIKGSKKVGKGFYALERVRQVPNGQRDVDRPANVQTHKIGIADADVASR